MSLKSKCFLCIVALLPLSLMADSILSNRDVTVLEDSAQSEAFELSGIVANQAAASSASYAATSSLYYYTGF